MLRFFVCAIGILGSVVVALRLLLSNLSGLYALGDQGASDSGVRNEWWVVQFLVVVVTAFVFGAVAITPAHNDQRG